MINCELINMRQMDVYPTDAHLHIGKPRFRRETRQFALRGGLAPARVKSVGCFFAHEAREHSTDSPVVRPEAVPNTKRETPAANEHASHLAERQCFIGKELEPLLAEDCVKAGIRQTEIERAPLNPFNRRARSCRERDSHADHSGIEIDTDHAARGTHTLRRHTCHDPGTTRHVQHRLTFREANSLDK